MARRLLSTARVLLGVVALTTDHAAAFDRLSTTKQTTVTVSVRIRPLDLLAKDPKLALKATISVESPQLFRVDRGATFTTSMSGKSGLGVESDGLLPRAPQQDLQSQLLEKPIFVVCGADRPGPEVWYVNGILTSKASAIEAGELISRQLGRCVHVLHNPTVIEAPFQTGLQVAGFRTGDLSESTYDRLWPAIVAGRLLVESFLDNSTACPERLQGNPTTRQLAWVLYHSDAPVSLITHSQGCLIARNAFFSMGMLGKAAKVRDGVAWAAAGIPINDCEICPRPKRTTVLDYRGDPVPKVIGLRGGGLPFSPADHFIQSYIDQLNNDLLFPVSKTASEEHAVVPL